LLEVKRKMQPDDAAERRRGSFLLEKVTITE